MEPPSLTREPRCPFWVMAGILRQLCLSGRKQGRLRKFGFGIAPSSSAKTRQAASLPGTAAAVGDASVVALPEKVRCHRQAHADDEASNPCGRKLLSVMGAEVSAKDRAYDHDAAFSPNHTTGHNESDDRDAIDDPAEHDLQGVHSVNFGHAECGQHREVQNSDPAAEVASVDR